MRTRAFLVAIGLLLTGIAACAAPQPSPPVAPSAVATEESTPAPTPISTGVSGGPVDLYRCPTPPSPPSPLTCEAAIGAAGPVYTGPPLSQIEFYYGWLCPPGARCAAPPPNVGYVVFRSDYGPSAVMVEVAADASGVVSATSGELPFPPAAGSPTLAPTATPSATAGPLGSLTFRLILSQPATSNESFGLYLQTNPASVGQTGFPFCGPSPENRVCTSQQTFDRSSLIEVTYPDG